MTYQEKLRRKISIMISILGEPCFYEMIDFFVNIMESTDEIKILMTRRLFDLYSSFEEIIKFLYDDNVKLQGRIVSNLSVVLYESNIKNCNILLVDDIILHGRALDVEYKSLLECGGCESEKIRAKVFLRNIDKKLINSDLMNRLDVAREVHDVEWRILSGKIINAFSAVGQPYISYLPYVEYDIDDMDASISQALNELIQTSKQVKEITTDMQRYYGIESFLYCLDNKLFDWELKVAQANFIRIYVLDRLRTVIIIPYSCLNHVKEESISQIFSEVEDKHFIQYGDDKVNLRCHMQVKDGFVYSRFMYSSITYLISMALGNMFFSSLGIKHVNWKEGVLSLGFKSAQSLYGREKVLVNCLNQHISGFVFQGDEWKAHKGFSEDVKKIYEKVVSEKGNMSQFIRECGKVDEERANNNKSRMKGVSVYLLSKLFNIDDDKTAWAKAISLADAGKVTIVVSPDKVGMDECVGSLLMVGEQNYTCNEENRILLVLPLIEFMDFCKINNHDFSKLKYTLIEKICSEFPEIKDNLLPDEFNEVVNSEVIKYRDYYVDRMSIYESNSTLKNTFSLVVQYEKGL